MFKLQDALEVIKNKPEFVVREREFGFVIDYNVVFAETFIGPTDRHTEILQNLRGTCFNRDGDIISLPYHKFMNLGENAAYHESNFDFSQPHVIQQKLDGSMIRPIPNFGRTNTGWEFGTRAGVTDVATKAWRLMDSWSATDYVKYKAYDTLINDCIELGFTPMFEFGSREQRIVIDYPEPRLVLTGVRSNETGRYLTHEKMYQLAHNVVDIVDVAFGGEDMSITDLAKLVKDLEGEEGVVVKFDDGRFVKIKATMYIKLHRMKDLISTPKRLYETIHAKLDDDVIANFPEYLDEISKIKTKIREICDDIDTEYNSIKVETQKEFASSVLTSENKSILFAMRKYSKSSIDVIFSMGESAFVDFLISRIST